MNSAWLRTPAGVQFMAVCLERILQERNLQPFQRNGNIFGMWVQMLGQIAWATSLLVLCLWCKALNSCRRACSCGSGFRGSRRRSLEFGGEESWQHPSFLQMVMAEVSVFAGPLFLVMERIGFLAPVSFLTNRNWRDSSQTQRFPLLSKREAP